MWVVSASKGRNHLNHTSDYQDNVVWPSRCVSTNLTMLAANNLSAVVSVVVLKLPGTKLVTPYGDGPDSDHDRYKVAENVRLLGRLQECETDFILAQNEMKSDRGNGETTDINSQMNKAAILRSFSEPKFGDDLGELPGEGKQAKTIRFLLNKTSSKACPSIFLPEIIGSRVQEAGKKLIGINWRLTNPGTQWTSSINPVMKHPKDWYGERYVSFRIGCEGIETCLRLFRLRDGIWKNLPRDVFRKIVIVVVWMNSYLEDSKVNGQKK